MNFHQFSSLYNYHFSVILQEMFHQHNYQDNPAVYITISTILLLDQYLLYSFLYIQNLFNMINYI